MKYKLRRKLPEIMAILTVFLILITIASLAVAVLHIALHMRPIPTMIICLIVTSCVIGDKFMRLFMWLFEKILYKFKKIAKDRGN